MSKKDTPFLRATEYMSKAIPGAQYMVISEAGHAANLDNAEVFNRAVLDFLRKLNLPKG